MTTYNEQHYEDVARVLRTHKWPLPTTEVAARDCWQTTCQDFADLFAADNPPSSSCRRCGEAKGTICRHPNEWKTHQGHDFGGFDRERFLEACGLEPENVGYIVEPLDDCVVCGEVANHSITECAPPERGDN